MEARELIKKIKKVLKETTNFTEGEEYLLIEGALGIGRDEIFLKQEFSDIEEKYINQVLKKRSKGKPLNKIFRKQNFYGFDFFINKSVLAPRQETELLVEKVANEVGENYPQKTTKSGQSIDAKICDMCCGSGCIGLTLAKVVKNVKITMCDISRKALRVAKKNRKLMGLTEEVEIRKGNMFSALKSGSKFDIIVCNPPYIESSVVDTLDDEVKKYDPIIALDGGKDGLDFYKILAKQGREFLNEDGKIFVEIGYNQGKAVESIFKNEKFSVKCFKDYSNQDRIVVASLKK